MKFHWSDFLLGVIAGCAALMSLEAVGLIEGWWW